MNLGRKFVDTLHAMQQTKNPKQFSLTTTGEDSGYVIEQEMDNVGLRVEIEDFDKFSYMVKSISVTRAQTPSPATLVKDVLLRQSGEIERRISYLLESFRMVELDEVNGSAQVRSLTPYRKDDEMLYYEVLLRGGNSLTFTRYHKQRQADKRNIVLSHLTQETLERLVDDLAAVIRLS